MLAKLTPGRAVSGAQVNGSGSAGAATPRSNNHLVLILLTFTSIVLYKKLDHFTNRQTNFNFKNGRH